MTIAATLSRFDDDPGAAASGLHGAIEQAVLELLDDALLPVVEAA